MTGSVLAHRRTWLMPVALIVGLAAALPAIYLSATADPQGTLHDLPIALVVEPQTAGAPAVSAEVADAIASSAGAELDLMPMAPEELAGAMAEDRVAGAIVIPAEFDASIATLLPGSTTVSVPTVSILTNAGDGGLSGGLVIANATPLVAGVAEGLGEQLVASAGGERMLPPASLALLSTPFHTSTAAFEPLPDHSGLGTSAFYLALVVVLLAFIGASLVGPIVDGALGFLPSELGPLVLRRPYTAVSRRRTFAAKAAILAGAAPLAAGALVAVTLALGVAVPEPLMLWLFAAASFTAVGVAALAVFAAFGQGVGSLVNTLFFVALSMVSSGGIVPLEATPLFFQGLSTIAPFHFVVEGVRALVYFDGNLVAGLGVAWLGVGVWAVVGVVAGVVVTTLYDRVARFSRHPRHADVTSPSDRREYAAAA